MSLMLITVGSESTIEVDINDISRYLTILRNRMGSDRTLTEIMEFFEQLIELMDTEEDYFADLQITTEEGIASIIFESGEGILNDEGVDEKVCADLGRAILGYLVQALSPENLADLKSVLRCPHGNEAPLLCPYCQVEGGEDAGTNSSTDRSA